MNRMFFLLLILLFIYLPYCRYIYISLQRYRNKVLRSHKKVEIKVFLNFLLVDGRIRIRTNITDPDPGSPPTFGSGLPVFSETCCTRCVMGLVYDCSLCAAGTWTGWRSCWPPGRRSRRVSGRAGRPSPARTSGASWWRRPSGRAGTTQP
jgi:hypothetical protein